MLAYNSRLLFPVILLESRCFQFVCKHEPHLIILPMWVSLTMALGIWNTKYRHHILEAIKHIITQKLLAVFAGKYMGCDWVILLWFQILGGGGYDHNLIHILQKYSLEINLHS
ncbi:hypothetical protein ACJX0J_006293 [Zea mays]